MSKCQIGLLENTLSLKTTQNNQQKMIWNNDLDLNGSIWHIYFYLSFEYDSKWWPMHRRLWWKSFNCMFFKINESIRDIVSLLKIIYCLKKWSGWSCCSFLLEPIDGIKWAKTKRLLKDQNYFNEMNVSYEDDYDNYTTFGKRTYFGLLKLNWQQVIWCKSNNHWNSQIVSHNLWGLFQILSLYQIHNLWIISIFLCL